MELFVSDILEAAGGRLLQGSERSAFKGVSVDTRTIQRGELFFALRGPNFDGHSFVEEARRKGASGAVVERPVPDVPEDESFVVVAVDDTLRALGDLARHVRSLCRATVVALSGSTGKTTTKEMTASILSRSMRVLKTEGNRNNLVGLPLTLLGLERDHDAAVVELGISVTGEMERLVEISAPDAALITNIGRGHLEGLGTVEKVAEEKLKIFKARGAGAVAVLNMDDPFVRSFEAAIPSDRKRVTFGSAQGVDVRIKGFRALGVEGIKAGYDVMGGDVEVFFNSPALCNVINGAAAIAAAVALGVSREDIKEGLSSFVPPAGRMVPVKAGNITVLDDTYNANPESMRWALKTLAGAGGRKVAVLGDMCELGEETEEAHREAGALSARLGIDLLVSIGRYSGFVKDGALAEGMDSKRVFGFEDKGSALSVLRGLIESGDTVLVKGSRAAGMEDIVRGLRGSFGSTEHINEAVNRAASRL